MRSFASSERLLTIAMLDSNAGRESALCTTAPAAEQKSSEGGG